MRQTYKKHRRKAGSRIATVRKLAESMSQQLNPNFDLDPFVLEPEASTVIKLSIKKHMNKKAYTHATVRFYTNLVLFKNVLTAFNANDNSKALAKSRLLNSIPVGRTLEAFLEVRNVVPSITRLRAILSDPDFSFPERNTQPYFELKGFIDDIIRLIRDPLQGRIEIPLIIQRQERVLGGPSNIGQGRRLKRSLRNKSLRNNRRS